jgi:hypothetical protein
MVGLSGTLHRRKESVHLPTDKSDVQQHHATAVSWILPASMSQVTICKTAALLRIVYGIVFLPIKASRDAGPLTLEPGPPSCHHLTLRHRPLSARLPAWLAVVRRQAHDT